MVNFINFNGEIRAFLERTYQQFYNEDEKDEASVKYFEFIEGLKNTNYNLYKIIVGLAFVDNYRLLIDKKSHKKLTENQQNHLEIYEQITDIDDLLFKIEEDPSLLSSIIYAPIKINHFNLKGKATILMQLDDDYVDKFNSFNRFEKYNIFKERTTEEFVFIYLNNSKTEEAKNETIYNIITILDLLYKYNLKNFSKLILDMIKVFYRYKKVIQHTNPELTFGIDEMIIDIVENNSLKDIVYTLSCNSDMIAVLVEDFLEFETNQELERESINAIYNKLVPHDVKIKLKEA